MGKPEEYKQNENVSPYWQRVLKAIREAARASEVYNPETITRTRVSNSITINGKTYKGSTVKVVGHTVFVDGKSVEIIDNSVSTLRIKVDGVLDNLIADGSVEAGLVNGDVQAGGSVNCDDVDGDVQAGGSVTCGKVNGSIMAGGSVRHN